MSDTTAPVTTEGLRERYAAAAAEWALMYPISSWALADGEKAEGLAKVWGDQIARYLTKHVRDEEVERLRAELTKSDAGIERLSYEGTEARINQREAEAELAHVKALIATCGRVADEFRRRDDERYAANVAERDALAAQVAAIRTLITENYGEDYDDEDVPAAVERLMRHLTEHEANVLRLRQSKNEALERAQAAIERVRRMAQVWLDIRPTYPTASDAGHGIAFAGQQILDTLEAPKAPGGES